MTANTYAHGAVTVHHGDCLDVLPALADGSVDAVVTDPPYGLEFMGKEWDRPWAVSPTRRVGFEGREDNLTLPTFGDSRNANCRGCGGRQRGEKRCTCAAPQWDRPPRDDMRAYQQWCERWAVECLRVLKPGGHLLAFGGTRTYHRLACAIEDAGFEIRDSIDWLYGSGFPKSLDVSKAIDRAAGAERDVIGRKAVTRVLDAETLRRGNYTVGVSAPVGEIDVAAPATEDAQRWQGWGTALKPAHEPIVVARKPLAGTVAGNVLLHGTGAINVDGCRVEWGTGGDRSAARKAQGYSDAAKRALGGVVAAADATGFSGEVVGSDASAGRWPANVLLTHAEGCVEVGEKRVRGITGGTGNHDGTVYGARSNQGQAVRDYADADGMETVAAWECVEGCPVAELDRQSGIRPGFTTQQDHATTPSAYFGAHKGPGVREGFNDTGGASRYFPTFRYEAKAGADERPTIGGVAHPTVKPLDLMRWLIRLVTPPGGVVLDPFLGSGTTAEAAVLERARCIGVERDPQYAQLIAHRLSPERFGRHQARRHGAAKPKPVAAEQDDLFGGAA